MLREATRVRNNDDTSIARKNSILFFSELKKWWSTSWSGQKDSWAMMRGGDGGGKEGLFVCSFLQWSFTILEGKYGRVSSSCAVESCPFAWIPCCKFCRWTEAVYHTRRSGGVSGCSCSCTPYRTCRTEMVSVMNICFSSKNLQFRGRNISIIRSNLRRKQKFKSTFYP